MDLLSQYDFQESLNPLPPVLLKPPSFVLTLRQINANYKKSDFAGGSLNCYELEAKSLRSLMKSNNATFESKAKSRSIKNPMLW